MSTTPSTRPLIAELTAACMALGRRPDGARRRPGRAGLLFAGADLNWMKRAANNSVDEKSTTPAPWPTWCAPLAEMKKPTIARAQGRRPGGGMGLTAVCDIAVADTGRCSPPPKSVRHHPSAISPYVVRAIGPARPPLFPVGRRDDAARAPKSGAGPRNRRPDQLDAKVRGDRRRPAPGAGRSAQAAEGLIRAVDNQPIGDDIVEDTAHRIAQPARRHAGSQGRQGLPRKAESLVDRG